MAEKSILLSIITVNLNHKQGLQKTIDSVVKQNFKNFELIIIDGASNDGSLEVIHQNEDAIKHWVSEKDNGVYQAMNKGVKVAKGEYLFFLNSGDTFFSNNTLEKIFTKKFTNKLIIGNTSYVNKNSISSFRHDRIHLDWFTNFNVNHQAVFFHYSVFNEFSLYDENLKICADHKLILDILMKEKFNYDYIDINVCNYEGGGLSAKPELENLRVEEKKLIHNKYFNEAHWEYLKSVQELRSELYNIKSSKLVRAALFLSRLARPLKK